MKVFYMPQQAARNPDSFSPSADKPRLVIADWRRRNLVSELDIRRFQPVGRPDFKLAHCDSFVDGILDLQLENGFGNIDSEVAASLPWTTGSLLGAARHAIQTREVTCSPTSGFHHAGYERAGGFCTFNGLMVVALKLRREGALRRVAILDCDVHYGDGTADIIRRLNLDWVEHHSMGRTFRERTDAGIQAIKFFHWLEKALSSARSADLVLYQAGADPHVDDPMGGILTTEEMVRRDAMVFAALDGRPVVWNLAGGYQVDSRGGISPVLRLHRNTLQAAVQQSNVEHFS
jgi:acetoin utilization deacetylase AcuC-like enzyme